MPRRFRRRQRLYSLQYQADFSASYCGAHIAVRAGRVHGVGEGKNWDRQRILGIGDGIPPRSRGGREIVARNHFAEDLVQQRITPPPLSTSITPPLLRRQT
jgi:hypothetical protein